MTSVPGFCLERLRLFPIDSIVSNFECLTALRARLGWIGDSFSLHSGPRPQRMVQRMGFIHDVLYLETPHQQRIRDERAMAPPGHRLGAHQAYLLLPGHVNQHLQILLELGCLHIVGKSPKGRVTPGLIRRIVASMTQASQACDMLIADASGMQGIRQGFLVELSVVPRPWYRPHIHEARHTMSLQKVQEGFERPRRMSDCQHDGWRLHCMLLPDRSPATATRASGGHIPWSVSLMRGRR